MQLIERPGKVALLAAMLMAFTLAGCGRKSSLDPPPAAAVQQPAQAGQAQPRPGNPFGLFEPDDEQVTAPPGQKRRLPIDAILD